MQESPPAVQSPRTKALGATTAGIGRAQLRTELVRVLARPRPATVSSDTPLGTALERMRAESGDAIIICDAPTHGPIRGILTERDVLARILGREVDPSRPVSDFMTAAPDTLAANATLLEAMRAMERGGYRNLPLIDDDGELAGLLRQQDLLEYIAEAFPQEILNLPPRPHQLMEEQEGA